MFLFSNKTDNVLGHWSHPSTMLYQRRDQPKRTITCTIIRRRNRKRRCTGRSAEARRLRRFITQLRSFTASTGADSAFRQTAPERYPDCKRADPFRYEIGIWMKVRGECGHKLLLLTSSRPQTSDTNIRKSKASTLSTWRNVNLTMLPHHVSKK